VLSLSNFDDLIKVALEKEYISDAEYQELLEWKKDPENWKNKK
jgi:orotate phosphoribosyltransferase